MKKLLLLSAAMLSCGLAAAQEVGRVISSTPIVQQIGQPRNVCTTEQVDVAQPKSGAGALMGAIAGGAMGNAVGAGAGRAAATMIGIMGEAIVGDNIEGAPMARTQTVRILDAQVVVASHEVFPNAACVVSLIDRLLHHSEVIGIEGESYRLKDAQARSAEVAAKRKKVKS